MVNEIEGVDLFLGGHEHGYVIYKTPKSIAIKSGCNFDSFNEIIIELDNNPI